MEYIFIGVVAFFASLVTFYTGFGLGTILMPVMAIFLPLPLAISITAVVHLFHSLLRTGLLWAKIDWTITLRFGGLAVLSAIPGVWLLQRLSLFPPIARYSWGVISWLHLLIGLLLILFGTLEMIGKRGVRKKHLVFGGILSGFFGGLTGNQGAFRSIFLVSSNLDKEAFIATSAAISTAVDLLRLTLYGIAFKPLIARANSFLLVTAITSALVAICIGMLWLPKVTIKLIQKWVIVLFYILGVLIAGGVL